MAAISTKAPEVYVATEGFVATIEGRQQIFVAGRTVVSADHPVLKIRPQAFRRQVPVGGGHVEQATAAPGEVRR
jgi:hypothetical protein